jgi:hypothetical protein
MLDCYGAGLSPSSADVRIALAGAAGTPIVPLPGMDRARHAQQTAAPPTGHSRDRIESIRRERC